MRALVVHDFYQQAAGEDWSSEFERTLAAVGQTRPGSVYVRNAFFLATPEGIAGRHNKDIPTMWENCFYIGGTDDGLIKVGNLTAGVALCQEFNRTQTVARLRGKADIVVGGSFTWGAPQGRGS